MAGIRRDKTIRLEENDFVALEEQLNKLMGDEKIRSLRRGVMDYLQELLKERLSARLNKAGITQALRDSFLDEKNPPDPFFEKLESLAKELKLSKKSITDLKRQAAVKQEAAEKSPDTPARKEGPSGRQCALDTLDELLLRKETIRFREMAKINPKIWRDMDLFSVMPGENVQNNIFKTLAMSEDQIARFRSLIIHRKFPVTDDLREKVFALRKETGLKLDEFQSYALITTDAWESFYPARDPDAGPKKVRQETLLKLVVGFGLEEQPSWDFLGIAGSVFADRRDLVVLSCICLGYQTPLCVMEVLDFFSQDGEGNLLYVNYYY